MDATEILERIRKGGPSAELALRGLYDVFAQRMLRNFVHHGIPAEEAEDVLQETIAKVLIGAQKISATDKPEAWIWTVARNCRIDHLRRRARREIREETTDPSIIDASTRSDGSSDGRADRGNIEDCVDKGLLAFGGSMPERAYVLTRAVFDKATINEIALEIGRTPSATKEYLYQCRSKLKPFIEHCLELLPEY